MSKVLVYSNYGAKIIFPKPITHGNVQLAAHSLYKLPIKNKREWQACHSRLFFSVQLRAALLYLEADFAVDPILGNLVILYRSACFMNIYRLDAPNAFRSLIQGILGGVFPTFTRTGHNFYYLDYHTAVFNVLGEELFYLHKIANLLDKTQYSYPNYGIWVYLNHPAPGKSSG
jgi:hypothetical protein